MLKRYPHTGKIIIKTKVDDSSGIPTYEDVETDIIGRYEPASQNKTLDYSGKFYCAKNAIDPFDVDGQPFFYEGRQFKIVQLHNYQTHCEIWLE